MDGELMASLLAETTDNPFSSPFFFPSSQSPHPSLLDCFLVWLIIVVSVFSAGTQDHWNSFGSRVLDFFSRLLFASTV